MANWIKNTIETYARQSGNGFCLHLIHKYGMAWTSKDVESNCRVFEHKWPDRQRKCTECNTIYSSHSILLLKKLFDADKLDEKNLKSTLTLNCMHILSVFRLFSPFPLGIFMFNENWILKYGLTLFIVHVSHSKCRQRKSLENQPNENLSYVRCAALSQMLVSNSSSTEWKLPTLTVDYVNGMREF